MVVVASMDVCAARLREEQMARSWLNPGQKELQKPIMLKIINNAFNK